jgi:integrase/recombinase XerD
MAGRAKKREATKQLALLVERFLEHRKVLAYARTTIEKNRAQLVSFVTWCSEREVQLATEVTRVMVEAHQRWLFDYRRADNDERLSVGEQRQRLGLIRNFFRWLLRERVIEVDPAADIELPKREYKLPEVFAPAEVARVLNTFDVSTELGLRDRAIAEVAYSTGLRRAELARLKLFDIDREQHTVTVRAGKGNRDRLTPIGERAVRWIDKYLDEVRPGLLRGEDDGTLFLSNNTGRGLHVEVLSIIMRKAVRASGVKKKGAVHALRHAMATAMVDAGASIRHVQAMLGHNSLSTTQGYVAVSMEQLRRVHAASHPEGKVSEETVGAEVAASSSELLRPGSHEPRPNRRRRG